MSKSQTSLFSFFKKSTSSATVPTVASDSKMDVMKPGSVVPKLNETKVKTLPPENSEYD